MSEQRKRWLALGLGLVWALLITVRIVTQDEPQRVPLKYKSGMTAVKETGRGEGTFGAIVYPLQAKAGQMPFQTLKNIFAPLEEQEEAAKRKLALARAKARANAMDKAGTASDKAKARESLPMAGAPPVPPPPPSPEEIARQQARHQLAQYRFVGYLTQGGESKAFLGKGREIYVVKTGDLLEERVRVHTIAASSVTLVDAGTNVEATIPLSQDGNSSS